MAALQFSGASDLPWDVPISMVARTLLYLAYYYHIDFPSCALFSVAEYGIRAHREKMRPFKSSQQTTEAVRSLYWLCLAILFLATTKLCLRWILESCKTHRPRLQYSVAIGASNAMYYARN